MKEISNQSSSKPSSSAAKYSSKQYTTPVKSLKSSSNRSHSTKPWLNLTPQDEDTITNELCEALKQVNELSDAVHSGASIEMKDILRQKKEIEEELQRCRQVNEEMRKEISDVKLGKKSKDSTNDYSALKTKLTDTETRLSSLQDDFKALSYEKTNMIKVIAALKDEKSEADADRNELCKKNVEYEGLLDRAMSDLQTVSEVNEDLATTLEEVSAEKDDALKKIKELAYQLNDNNSEHIVLENVRLQSALDDSNKGNSSSSSQIKVLLSENDRLEKELKELATEKERVVEKLRDISSIFEKRKESYKIGESELKQLKHENMQLIRKIDTLSKEKLAIEKELYEVSKENVSSSSRFQDSALMLSEKNLIERKLSVTKLENESLKSEINEMKHNEEITKLKFNCILKDKEDIEKNVKRLESSKDDLLADVQSLTECNKKLNSKIENLEEKNINLDKVIVELSKFAREREELFKKNKKLEADVESSASEKSKAQSSVSAISSSLVSAQSEIKLLKNQKRALDEKLYDEKMRAKHLEKQVALGIEKGNEASKLINNLKNDIEKNSEQARKILDEKRNMERLLFKSTVEGEGLRCEVEDSKGRQQDIASKLDIVLSKHETAISIIEEYDKQTNELHTNISELKILNKDLYFEQGKLTHDLSVTAAELEQLKNKKRKIFSDGFSIQKSKRNQGQGQSSNQVQGGTNSMKSKINFHAIGKTIATKGKQGLQKSSKGFRYIATKGKQGAQKSSKGFHLMKEAGSRGIDTSLKRMRVLSDRLRKINQKQNDELCQPRYLHSKSLSEQAESKVDDMETEQPLWPTLRSPGECILSSFGSYSEGPQDMDLGLLPSPSFCST